MLSLPRTPRDRSRVLTREEGFYECIRKVFYYHFRVIGLPARLADRIG
jgi:hypothetical protein